MAFEHELWLVVGNAFNWGRSENFHDALGNAIKSAGSSSPMTEAHIYRLRSNTELKGSDLWIDDFGQVHYSNVDTQLDKLPNWKVPKRLTDAFFAFDLEVEEVQYGPVFDKAFPS